MRRGMLLFLLGVLLLGQSPGTGSMESGYPEKAEVVPPVPSLVISLNGTIFYGDFAENAVADAFLDALSREHVDTELDENYTGMLPWTLPEGGDAETAFPGHLVLVGENRIRICLEETEHAGSIVARIRSGNPDAWRQALGEEKRNLLLWVEWSE